MDETEPTPGVEPDHTAYEAGARPSRSMGRNARGARVRGDRGANAASSEESSLEWRSHLIPFQGTWVSSPGACRACPSERELQREESNLRVGRLTGGCRTIRLRWKKSARRGAWSNVLRVSRSSLRAPNFQRARGAARRSCDALGSGHRIRTCVSGFRDQRPAS